MGKITTSKILLNKYLSGDCTADEKAIVEGWFNNELSEGEYHVNLLDLQQTEDQIWAAIQAHQKDKAAVPLKKIKLWTVISAAAASIAVMLMFSIYFVKNNHKPASVALHTVITPAKENNLIQLSDGSMVIMDKGSKLSFARSFKGKRLREVYLTGKAFFDIKHNPSQPFIVHSGKIKTTVLGTAFDISANPDADEIIVRVIRGKVNVSTDAGTLGDLLPNKKIIYHVKTDQSSFANVNAKQEMQWTSQDMLLNDITFEAICTQLEKRYNVKINIEDNNLKSKKFTISLTANENLNNFLSTVCDFNSAKYQYDKTLHQYTITSIN